MQGHLARFFGQAEFTRAPEGAMVHDKRHRPEQTTPYCLVQQHAATFMAQAEANVGADLPHHASTRHAKLTLWKAPAAGRPTSKRLSADQKVIDRQARRTISEIVKPFVKRHTLICRQVDSQVAGRWELP